MRTVTDANMPDERHGWRDELTVALAKRLSTVRGAMSDTEFSTLLRDMVKTAERFLEIDSHLGQLPVAPEPDEMRRQLNLKD
jgi:hypothetical protein